MNNSEISNEQLNNKLLEINQLINSIEQGITNLSNESKSNVFTEDNTKLIKKTTDFINSQKYILTNSKQITTQNIYNSNYNEQIKLNYMKLIEQLKFSTTNDKIDINNKICYLKKLNYSNLEKPIINMYLISILSKLICLNISFKFFEKLKSIYEITSVSVQPINTEILFGYFNELFKNSGTYFLITDTIDNYESVNGIGFDYSITKESKIKEINDTFNIKKKFDTIKKINFKHEKLEFNIILEYNLKESLDKDEKDVILKQCNITSGVKFDSSMLLNEKIPSSRFIINFKVQDGKGNNIINNITFNLEYYKCYYGLGFLSTVNFRYEFYLKIDNGSNQFLNPSDSSNTFKELII